MLASDTLHTSYFCAQVGNDASQFVGPVFLNLLLAAMQNGESAWKGYLYGVSIFLGLVSHRPFQCFHVSNVYCKNRQLAIYS
jgi:hypothetical protein